MKRSVKRLLVRACNPLDYAARVINGKKELPPLHLRWEVGPLRAFETAGAEFRVYLKLFANLKPDSRVLDIGCGSGQIALELNGHQGKYVGCDINREAIDWCTRAIAGKNENFQFHHLDVRNGLYNPDGAASAATFRFPPSWGQFDVLLLKSVFTHMLKPEMENYLSQLPSLLREDGKCMATFFLLNDDQRKLAAANRNTIRFVGAGGSGQSVANPNDPEAIVAFEEELVMELLARHGLRLARPVMHGSWTGDLSGLSHQDILVIEKAH